MKRVTDLQLGFSDAENYRRRENKELLNQLFIRNEHLDRLCEPAIAFLVGEKGTGKTAYAVYLQNNDYHDTLSHVRYIRETDYIKFLSLKRDRSLDLSDFTNIWKVILFVLVSQQINEHEGKPAFLKRFTKFAAVQQAVDEYYNNAFAPEIVQALQLVQESKVAAELLAKYIKMSVGDKQTFSFTETRFQTNLLFIQKTFEEALSQVRLKTNHIIFIDGIDVRPSSIPYPEYVECIKGLANAIWELNNDYFPSIKGGEGRMRVVLLLRPDIFVSLGLQNLNTKSRDNSVFLDWRTNYASYRTSDLFRVTAHLVASQQDEPTADDVAWDHYFPWDAPTEDSSDQTSSFLSFLRFSYHRPRDIITMLTILRDNARRNRSTLDYFERSAFSDATFRREYSAYLLGEIKDHLTFYYSIEEWELFLKFFEYLNGKKTFAYADFLVAYRTFTNANPSVATSSKFMANAGTFLQFLYDLNVINYMETSGDGKRVFRFCYRERTYANISPKVKEGMTYEIFYGLQKALNVGAEYER